MEVVLRTEEIRERANIDSTTKEIMASCECCATMNGRDYVQVGMNTKDI